jgi:hypothetical protein
MRSHDAQEESMAEPLTRVNFFDGMLLTGEDLRVEQDYLRRKQQLHNQIHGYGVVEGLDVTVDSKNHMVHVAPGWAIDRQGREVVLVEPWCSEEVACRHCDVVISWAEVAAGPVPARPDDGLIHTRWVEQPELSLVAPGEAGDDALVLARVKRGRLGKLLLDQSVRRPLGRD